MGRMNFPIYFMASDRHRRVVELLGLLWLLSLADLFLTIWAHRFMAVDELNPIARAMLHRGTLGALVLFKVLMTGLGTAIFWSVRGHGRAELGLWMVVLIYVALGVRWSHILLGASLL
jgi:hypothetical protein